MSISIARGFKAEGWLRVERRHYELIEPEFENLVWIGIPDSGRGAHSHHSGTLHLGEFVFTFESNAN